MNKIVLVGCGNVGISYIYSLLNLKINIDEIAIIDLDVNKVKGEVIDFEHCLPFLKSDTFIHVGDYEDCKNATIVCITAGARQVVGETRLDLIAKNKKLFKSIIPKIVDSGFQGIFLNTTNPVDILTDLIYRYSNFDSKKVIGSGTYLDTARLEYSLHNLYQASYDNIKTYVLGEHGDSSVVAWSNTYVNDVNVLTNLFNKEQLVKKIRNAGYELLNTKGYSSSAIGLCLAKITETIINDEKEEYCVSNYDKDQDIYYGSPAVIGKEGIVKRSVIKLNEEEENLLKESIRIIKETKNL